ncbi:N-acetylmuramate alpha-1-phosphate uridylyltransferase MurU [Jeongeupia naejangsanensis]|uniref:Nucleotidyltransferase family protein n=1 Tax=Jeongeupia naejangsanensis TaxID=613195 RepID=A0ABS2BNL2_9NEIS|nr:nucleotidyltransferase family protein [Jeongeupia naejangsanensis]MBM3117217.1 nucleotidyltransferase family protein [Jeongeupia naejangsanensis]
MKAMILAAGRGERMRPLTDTCPKPLLDVGGTPLIGWHLRRLAAAGITDVVINHAWLGGMIEAALGDGSAYGVRIAYSPETSALETAGGIAKALPLLGDAPFAVINGDVFTDYDFGALAGVAERLRANDAIRAHLVLTPKAGYPTGRDLAIAADGLAKACDEGDAPMTFCGIAVYHPAFFAAVPQGQASPLLPHFLTAMARRQVGAERFDGLWLDVGTVERLEYAGKIARSCVHDG